MTTNENVQREVVDMSNFTMRPATWPETEDERLAYFDWQYEVGNGDTVLGFRDWVAHRDEWSY